MTPATPKGEEGCTWREVWVVVFKGSAGCGVRWGEEADEVSGPRRDMQSRSRRER